MIRCPINYFQDNIIFSADKSCWSVFRLNGYDYDFLSVESKITMLYRVARVLASITSEAKILIIPDVQDLGEHFRKLKENLSVHDVLHDAAVEQLDMTYEYLQSVVNQNGSNNYKTYLVTKLQDSSQFEGLLRIKELYEYFLKDPLNCINVLMNTDAKDILKSKVDSAMRLADKMFQKLNQRIGMQRVEVREMQWLFRRIAFRGINKAVSLFDGEGATWKPKAFEGNVGNERVVHPDNRDILRLFEGRIRQKDRTLIIDTDDTGKKSYQTFLCLTNLPDTYDYPGQEWIYMLQDCNEEAEVCINIKVIEHRESLRRLERKRQEFNSQIEHAGESNADLPEDLIEGKEDIDKIEAELKADKAPLLNTSVTICLSADNRKALEQKVSTVKNLYSDANFGIERPISDQLELYYQFIPGTGQLAKDFVMPLTPLAVASGVIGATHQLGDDCGAYIGTTGSEGKPVFLSLGRACLMNKSASTAFLGNLGVGKSFNANLLIYLTVLYSGGYSLIFDPKGERTHWAAEDSFPALQGLITVVTLSSSEEHKGRLDPYNIYKDDLDMANELAINLLSELFEIKSTSKEYVTILEAVKSIEEGEGRPSMLKLANKLDSFDKKDKLYDTAKMLARIIRLQRNAGMTKLLFGDGTEAAISLENRINILQIQNLKLPTPETKKENYSTEEKLSTVLMMVIGHFAKKFAMVKRPVFKLIDFDEAWALGKTAEGIKLYDFLTRMGRSLFSGCIFNTHSVADIPEGVINTITYKFCFHTENEDEIDRMIKFLKLENTPELRGLIASLGNGQCLFQDLDGHTGVLQFDAVFQDLIDVFSTTPVEGENTSEESSSDVLEEKEVQKDSLEQVQSETTDEFEDEDIDIYQREVV